MQWVPMNFILLGRERLVVLIPGEIGLDGKG